MGLLDDIKNDVKKSGQNKGKFIYFREGTKQRVRFLNDMDDGMKVIFHDSFEAGINVPCQEETFGRNCPYCDDDSLRTRSQYIWSVWNYETKEVQLFMFPVNNCSPIPALMAMYENYGTLTDRDYVISVTGKQQNKTFSVVPMDKVRFRNEKAKPFSEKAILKMLDKAFPCEGVEDDDDEDDDEYDTKLKKRPAAKSSKTKSQDIEDDDEYDDENENDYDSMTPQELFRECKKRKISAVAKKPKKYYINLLEEYDKAQEDWDEEDDEYDDEEDWEEDDE